MFIACKRKHEIDNLKLKFSNEFDMKDLIYVKKIHGTYIIRTFEIFFASQRLYLEKVLKIFSMFVVKIVIVPLGIHIKVLQ